MNRITLHAIAAALLGLAVSAQADRDRHDSHDARPVRATATISGCVDARITGKAKLVERASDEGVKEVSIKLMVKGLPDGKHAVHLHESGFCQPCSAAGGHFDPGPHGNSAPDGNHPYHLGDLVNIEVRKGVGKLSVNSTRVTLSPGPLSLFDADGSAFIIHTQADTYCPNGAVAGCAGGAREACGIVERVADDGKSDDWFD